MKKFLYSSICMLTAISASAQTASYSGVYKDYPGGKLFTMDALALDGNLTPVEVAPDGTFSFERDASKPAVLFLLSEDPKGGLKFPVVAGIRGNFTIENKTVINGADTVKTAEIKYSGDLADDNDIIGSVSYFDAQNAIIAKMQQEKLTFAQFREELRQAVDREEIKLMAIKNPQLRNLIRDDYEKKYVGSLPWWTYFNDTPDQAFNEYAEAIDRNNPVNTNNAITYASFYQKYYMPKDGDPNLTFFSNLDKVFSSPEAIHAVADNYLEHTVFADVPENVKEVYEAYSKAIGDRDVPQRLQDLYITATGLKAGADAPDFVMETAKGKKVKLSSLKGKALYIDLWATWCGPCKAEIPYMEKLYEHYKGNKKIELVSISLDSNVAAWKKMIAKDKPGWPQYVCPEAFESECCKQYRIEGIPRFLMIDKKGKIVTSNAMRPSSPGIIDFIDSVINK